MSLESIKYRRGHLEILDQLLLPTQHVFTDIADTDAGWHAIKNMQVRGAPAIAVMGCLSLAVELEKTSFSNLGELTAFVSEKMGYLVTARPTAVNIQEAGVRFSHLVKTLADEPGASVARVKQTIIEELELMFEDDIAANKAMGDFGARHIIDYHGDKQVRVLTHCNTGSLATAGYGTGLGVIRTLHHLGRLEHTFCTETRPYNQGARLTAYELVYDNIPATLICDDMVSMAMKKKNISAVIVGADRVVRNGDTANKIGTYQLAICAKYHEIPFYVACPVTTFDPDLVTGDEIVIEERPHAEMTHIKGVQIAADGIKCFNPAFDVTPAELITGGIITEYGVFPAAKLYKELSNLDVSRNKSLPRCRSKAKFQIFTSSKGRAAIGSETLLAPWKEMYTERTGTGLTPDGCEDGWRHFRNYCYSFVPAQVHFDSAKGVCMVKGASLVSLWQQDELNFVTHNLKQVVGPAEAAWVGLVPEPGGTWGWMDGSLFDQPTEVLPSDEADVCGSLVPNGNLRYLDCGLTVSAFVCKKPLHMLYVADSFHNISTGGVSMEPEQNDILFEKIRPPLLNDISLENSHEYHIATIDVTKETDCAYRCYIVDDCRAFIVSCKSSIKCYKRVCTLLTGVKRKSL